MTEGACVYVVGPIGDSLKVGYTGSLSVRMRKLREEFGEDIVCLRSFPVARDRMRQVEDRAHEILKSSWCGRELFAVPLETAVAAVIQAIDELGAGRDDPDLGNRTASIGVKLMPSLKEALDEAAAEDGRSTSQLVERLVIAYLREKGRWPK